MNNSELLRLLETVKSGRLSPEEAVKKLADLPYEEMSFAKVDHHRHLRQGIPEVVFAAGKTMKQVVTIARSIHKKSGRVLITRSDEPTFRALRIKGAEFHPASGIIDAGGETTGRGKVLVLTAGTSDIPVAEEAAVTAAFLGSSVETIYDVGVAGLHRLLDKAHALKDANVIVVVAGMEGALPSVVGGLTDRPLVAVPSSVGYGTSFGGLTALFAMLNSCVPGIAVMNIDNGFGAACLAHRINMLCR